MPTSSLISIDETYVTQTLARLVQIDSRNPALTPDGPGETEIGRFVAELMENLGLEVTTYEPETGRPNVVGILPGAGGGRSLLWNAHMDTVGVEGMQDPFSGAIRDGKLYGRGSQDMKGGLAAMLAAAKALVDSGIRLRGDLLVTGVADEEHASLGADDLVRHHTADAAIVTEPTDLQLCRAHRGFIWYQIETIGRAAHGSRYKEGIDANMRMGRFLAKLDQVEQQLRASEAHPLVGPPSLHASLIQGGTAITIYSDRCVLKVERRTCPGESEAEFTQQLQDILDQLASEDETFRSSLEVLMQRPPFEIDQEADIVGVAEQALQQRTGKPAIHAGATFWTDAAILAEAGMPTILLGPTGQGLHSAEEWVEIDSVVDLAHILATSAIQYCGA